MINLHQLIAYFSFETSSFKLYFSSENKCLVSLMFLYFNRIFFWYYSPFVFYLFFAFFFEYFLYHKIFVFKIAIKFLQKIYKFLETSNVYYWIQKLNFDLHKAWVLLWYFVWVRTWITLIVNNFLYLTFWVTIKKSIHINCFDF